MFTRYNIIVMSYTYFIIFIFYILLQLKYNPIEIELP